MKIKTTALLLIGALTASANVITLTPEQEKNWQLESRIVQSVDHVPLGNFMMEVTVPPQLFQAVSLPFEAQVTQLLSAEFTDVKKGDLLANATGQDWISVQKEAIAGAIELMHQEYIAERKTKLCAEEIIAQKECMAADAKLRMDEIKVAASKTVLKTYGATDKMINTLFGALTISPNVPVSSPVEGTILKVNIRPGETIASATALFIIKRKGDYWLESDLSMEAASKLVVGQKVFITLKGVNLSSRVLQLSPTINSANQTRHVRFSLNADAGLLVGIRDSASLMLPGKALLMPKIAVVKSGSEHIVFVKESGAYRSVPVTLLGEIAENYYIRFDEQLSKPVVISAASVFKGMLGDEGNE